MTAAEPLFYRLGNDSKQEKVIIEPCTSPKLSLNSSPIHEASLELNLHEYQCSCATMLMEVDIKVMHYT